MRGASPEYNGLYALIKWTVEGQKKITDRAYRYMSPTMTLDENGRPTSLVNVALTNRPNFDLPPILNSEDKSNKSAMTEDFDMDYEKMKTEIKTEILNELKDVSQSETAKADEPVEVSDESETTGKACENTDDSEKDVSQSETTKVEDSAESEDDADETIKQESLNTEVVSMNADVLNTTTVPNTKSSANEEWRNLKGDDLIRWCRRHPDVC